MKEISRSIIRKRKIMHLDLNVSRRLFKLGHHCESEPARKSHTADHPQWIVQESLPRLKRRPYDSVSQVVKALLKAILENV